MMRNSYQHYSGAERFTEAEWEMEVAKQLTQGRSHDEIALNIAIVPAIVRNYNVGIHAKLGTSKVAQVATLLLNEVWL